jgi:hypothetical protein
MFAVLAEDPSDADTLVALVRGIIGQTQLKVRQKGFGGCGELRIKAPRYIKLFAELGATRFIICHDSDGKNPADIRAKVEAAIKKKGCSTYKHAVVVPVEELEAWMIADEEAIARVIPSLTIKAVKRPESIQSPKEWLVNKSTKGRSKPLYVPAIHNHQVARHIDLEKLEKKCPSFGPLKRFVES